MDTRLLLFAFLLFGAVLPAQVVYTIAGLPKFHRSNLDGKPALDAKLNLTYGLLLDRQTGRILLHDEFVVSRLEPDGTLFALAGLGAATDGANVDGTLASYFRFGILSCTPMWKISSVIRLRPLRQRNARQSVS